jgi:protease IV
MKKNKIKNKVIISSLIIFAVLFIFYLISLMSSYKTNTKVNNENKFFKIQTSSDAEIGVLKIEGVIMESDDIISKIRILEKKESVKGVIIRINSPGGSVGASEEIYNEIKYLSTKKPVITSISNLAASGGYYVAIGSDFIFSNKGSITGSIGVIMQLAYLEKLYEFIKISPIVIKSGKFKDLGSSHRKMKPEEKKLLQALSDNMHDQFKTSVSKERKIPMEIIDNIADGRIFSGQQALELGLIDKIGTFGDSVRFMKKKLQIKEAELFYPRLKARSFKDFILEFQDSLKDIFFNTKNSMPVFM